MAADLTTVDLARALAGRAAVPAAGRAADLTIAAPLIAELTRRAIGVTYAEAVRRIAVTMRTVVVPVPFWHAATHRQQAHRDNRRQWNQASALHWWGPPPSRRSQTTRHGLSYPTVNLKVRFDPGRSRRSVSRSNDLPAARGAAPHEKNPRSALDSRGGVRSAHDPAHIAESVRP